MCRDILLKFRGLDDVRGQYKRLPNPKENSRKGNEKAILDKWDDRLCVHFRINKKAFHETMCFNKEQSHFFGFLITSSVGLLAVF